MSVHLHWSALQTPAGCRCSTTGQRGREEGRERGRERERERGRENRRIAHMKDLTGVISKQIVHAADISFSE